MPTPSHSHKSLYQDTGIIALSILIALLVAQSAALERFITSIGELRLLGSFLAGTLFTSVFTTAPATVVLGEMAQANSAWTVALAGALGAVAGDYLIFYFVRERFAADMLHLLQQHGRRRLPRIIKLRSPRWLLAALGMLIIASPLPDEVGVALLGLSKTHQRFFLILSLAANFLGILAIGLIAKSV
jgi:hypothetical protein